MSSASVPDDFDVLARGVEDLDHLLVGHQLEERRKIDVGGERVDDHGLLGRGHLRDAQQRIIGGLAQELGIDGHERMRRHPPARGGKFGRGGDQVH